MEEMSALHCIWKQVWWRALSFALPSFVMGHGARIVVPRR